MSDKIKKLEDAQKEWMRICGIDPSLFQQQVQAVKAGKSIKSVKVADINKDFHKASGRLSSIKSIVEKMEATAPAPWIPLGYVLFLRTCTCKHCGRVEECLDCPSLYLVETDRPRSTTRRYKPTELVSYPKLPRWTKEVVATSFFCRECYQHNPIEESAETEHTLTPTGDEQCQPS